MTPCHLQTRFITSNSVHLLQDCNFNHRFSTAEGIKQNFIMLNACVNLSEFLTVKAFCSHKG